MTRYYGARFGPTYIKPWTRVVVFKHDSVEPPSHETLVCLAGNEISDTLISEGADPLAYRYGEPQSISAHAYACVAAHGGMS